MERVADGPMAFYRPYVEATRAASYTPDDAFDHRLRELLSRSTLVLFVPTKYRVHHALLASGETLPSARLDYLRSACAASGRKCEDLTAVLVAAAKRAAAGGRTTWWRDDTHWNGAGIAGWLFRMLAQSAIWGLLPWIGVRVGVRRSP